MQENKQVGLTDSDSYRVADVDDAMAWVQLATALLKNRRYDEAIDVLHTAVQCDPSDSRAWLVMSHAYYRMGRLEDARSALEIVRRNHGAAEAIEHCLKRIERGEHRRESRVSYVDGPEIRLDEAD